jgi:hypothetical protein
MRSYFHGLSPYNTVVTWFQRLISYCHEHIRYKQLRIVATLSVYSKKYYVFSNDCYHNFRTSS